METSFYYVGLDVGGSTMKGGVVDESGRPLSSISLPTEAYKGQEFGLERMCETIQAAVKSAGLQINQISAIGVATPGTMDIPGGIILDPPNLRPWQNMPVREPIQERFKVPTAFQNDANAAAMGEFWVGAGKDLHSLVLYTLGTGVGGGIILGGEVVQGEHSHGAELGHVRIEMSNPRRCGCGRMGCLEAYASATAVLKRTREALAQDGKSRLKSDRDFTAKDVFDAAALGDALAEKIVEETAFYLAVGTVNMMHTIDPDVVAFAGGMIAAGDGFLQRIRRHVLEMAFPVPAAKTKILYAKLGSDAGFIGAAACGRQTYLKLLKRKDPA